MHVPVLLKEVLQVLDIQPTDIVLDCTLGGAGHGLAICQKLNKNKNGHLIGIDADENAALQGRLTLTVCPSQVTVVRDNFRNLKKILGRLNIKFVNKALFDLGLSSNLLESSGRGFTFTKDEPLLMTYAGDKHEGPTAKEIVNSWSLEKLEDALRDFADERNFRRIAMAIIESRKKRTVNTTFELVEIIRDAMPARLLNHKPHFATKTFQALRIAANDEFEVLKESLSAAFASLSPLGRLAVISFHSGEDRIVKNFNRELLKAGAAETITKKPTVPTRQEILTNPRARSAKLRAIIKL